MVRRFILGAEAVTSFGHSPLPADTRRGTTGGKYRRDGIDEWASSALVGKKTGSRRDVDSSRTAGRTRRFSRHPYLQNSYEQILATPPADNDPGATQTKINCQPLAGKRLARKQNRPCSILAFIPGKSAGIGRKSGGNGCSTSLCLQNASDLRD